MASDTLYDSIALVDLSAIFAKHWFGSAKQYDQALDGTVTAIERVDRSVSHTVVCLDAPPYFRKDMYPAYKANRPPVDPLQTQCKRAVLAKLEERGYRLARAPGYEADDVIATCAAVYRLVCDDVRLIGNDKDLLQLVNGKVKLFKPAHGDDPETLVDGPGCFHITGVAPAQICDWLALVGDDSDNIPGCPGVGKKTATDLISSYGTLDALYRAVEGKPAETQLAIGKAKFFKLQENKAQVLLARDLVELRINAPIDANDLLNKGERKPVNVVFAAPVPGADGDDTVEGDDGKAFDEAVAAMPMAAAAEAKRTDWAAQPQRMADVVTQHFGISAKPEAELLDPAKAISAAKPDAAPVSTEQVKAVVAAAHAKAHATEVVGNDVGPEGKPNVSMVVRESSTPTSISTLARGPAWDLALEPKGLNQAKWVAEALAPMFPKLGGWYGCLAIIMLGRELGLGTMAALMNFDIVEERPSPRWQLVVAFATQHPDCEYFRMVESTDKSATFETKRRQNDTPDRMTYTLEMARKAGLVKPKGGWDKHPEAMCRKMCAVHLSRAVYPDNKATGLYCPEEMAA